MIRKRHIGSHPMGNSFPITMPIFRPIPRLMQMPSQGLIQGPIQGPIPRLMPVPIQGLIPGPIPGPIPRLMPGPIPRLIPGPIPIPVNVRVNSHMPKALLPGPYPYHPGLHYINQLNHGNLGFRINIPPQITQSAPVLVTKLKKKILKYFIQIGKEHFQCDLSEPKLKTKLMELIKSQIDKRKNHKEPIKIEILYYCDRGKDKETEKKKKKKILNKLKNRMINYRDLIIKNKLKSKYQLEENNDNEISNIFRDYDLTSSSDNSDISDSDSNNLEVSNFDSNDKNTSKSIIKLFTNDIIEDNYATYKIIPYKGIVPNSYYEKLITSSFNMLPTIKEEFD